MTRFSFFRMALPISLVVWFCGVSLVSAAPQANEDYKWQLLEQAADSLKSFEHRPKVHKRLKARLIRSAAMLGHENLLAEQLANFPESEEKLLAYCDAIELLAAFGHRELCLATFDGAVDTGDELEMLVNLAEICGRMGPQNERFFQQVLTTFKIVPFGQRRRRDDEEERGFGASDSLTHLAESDIDQALGEVRLSYVCALLDSGAHKYAGMVAEEVVDERLRQVAQVAVLQRQADQADFPGELRFDWEACQLEAQNAKVRWQMANEDSLLVAELLLDDYPDEAFAYLTLEQVIRKALADDPVLPGWSDHLKTRAAHQLLDWYDKSASLQDYDQASALYSDSLTNAGGDWVVRTLVPELQLPQFDRIVDSVIGLGGSKDGLDLPVSLRSRRARSSYNQFLLKQHLKLGNWEQAEAAWAEIQRLEDDDDPFEDSPKKIDRSPLLSLCVKAAATLGRYDEANEFISRMTTINSRRRARLVLAVWQIKNGDGRLAEDTLEQYRKQVQKELKYLQNSSLKLERLIEKAMVLGWQLGPEIDILPASDIFEREILAVEKPTEAIKLLNKYQQSFTEPGPASMAFAERMVTKLRSQHPETVVTDPEAQLQEMLDNFSLAWSADYDPQSQRFVKHMQQLIELARKVQDRPSADGYELPARTLRKLAFYIAKDGEQDSMDEILAMIYSPQQRFEAMLDAAEHFPPAAKSRFGTENTGQHWQSRRTGGVF